MRHALITALVAALVAAAFTALPAYTTSTSSTVTVKGLQRQVNGLRREVNGLRREVRANKLAIDARVRPLEADLNCSTRVLGVTRYNGYVWTDGADFYTTTAWDSPAVGQAPAAWVQQIDASCVTSGMSTYSTSSMAPQRLR